jgi:hypothetical protein
MEVLGTIAASLQLGGTALKLTLETLEMCRDINETPERVTYLLRHLEREVKEINRLLHPDNPVRKHLSKNRSLDIEDLGMEAKQVMEDIIKELQPFAEFMTKQKDKEANQPTIKRPLNQVKRHLKLLAAYYHEKAHKNKIKAFEQLNKSLQRIMRAHELELQSSMRTDIIEVGYELAAMRQTRAVEEVRNQENLHMISRGIGQSHATLRRLETQMLDYTTEVESHTRLGYGKVEELVDTTAKDMKEMLLQGQVQAAQDQHELRALLQDFTTRQVGYPGCATDVQVHARTAILDASQHTIREDTLRIEQVQPYRRKRLAKCTCDQTSQREVWRFGNTRVRFGKGDMHMCPRHGQRQFWACSVEMMLNPLVSGALEVTLGFLGGGRQWQISSPLRFRSLVKRSESAIFKLFDQFIRSVPREVNKIQAERSGGSLLSVKSEMSGDYVYLSWNAKQTTELLQKLVNGIQAAIESGLASADDYDENGWTILTVTWPYYNHKIPYTNADSVIQVFDLHHSSDVPQSSA